MELVANALGDHEQEFWIKCVIPQRVVIKFSVTKSMFQIFNEKQDGCKYVLLDFGKTYFGVNMCKRIIIQNKTASKAKFCVMAEVNREIKVTTSCSYNTTDYWRTSVIYKMRICPIIHTSTQKFIDFNL